MQFSMNQVLRVVVFLAISSWSGLCLAGEIAVRQSPAMEISYPTEAGKLYQLQRYEAKEDKWVDAGLAVKGDGKPVKLLEPGQGKYRVADRTGQWSLVWADEFEGAALDGARWSKEENGYGGGNNEKQFYSVDSKYCYVRDGLLNLALYRDSHTTPDGKTQPYSSARIRTLNRGEWTYGRFEMRAKMPSGEGIWPAGWMMPTDSKYGGWAACGEIDIFESRGNAVKEAVGTIHFGGGWPRNRNVGASYSFPAKNAAEDFHVYALEWEPDALRWYVDGVCYQTRTSEEWDSENAKENPRAPFDQPFHLILNVAADGGFFKGTGQDSSKLPDSAFPQVLQVDFVRVWQK